MKMEIGRMWNKSMWIRCHFDGFDGFVVVSVEVDIESDTDEDNGSWFDWSTKQTK
jgi:hypothetical protein